MEGKAIIMDEMTPIALVGCGLSAGLVLFNSALSTAILSSAGGCVERNQLKIEAYSSIEILPSGLLVRVSYIFMVVVKIRLSILWFVNCELWLSISFLNSFDSSSSSRFISTPWKWAGVA